MAVAIALEPQHANALIAHGFAGHRCDVCLEFGIGGIAPDIALAAGANQCCHDSVVGQGPSCDGAEALAPGKRADVFEIDRQQSCISAEGAKGEEVVVEAKAATSHRISPAGQELLLISLREAEGIVDAHHSVGLALLLGAEAIGWQRQRRAHWLEGQQCLLTCAVGPAGQAQTACGSTEQEQKLPALQGHGGGAQAALEA